MSSVSISVWSGRTRDRCAKNLIEIQNNEEFKIIFQKRLSSFWIRFLQKLWIKVKLFVLAFPSSYLGETGFSAVNHVLTKSRINLMMHKEAT